MAGVDINAMFEKAKELDQLRKEQEDVLSEINKLHKKLQSNPDFVEKTGDGILIRLRTLYLSAKELAENEANGSMALLSQIEALQQSGTTAPQRKKMEVGEQKKKRMKSDPELARLPSASIRSQLEHAASLKGEQVAARVINEDRAEWFVVKVIHFDREAKEFDVLDEDPEEDEESIQKKYKLPMSCIIPFPKRSDPSSAPDFAPGKNVLAVYPGTTALYKATVVNTPRKRKTDDYLLEFDDDEQEDGSLPQRVVPFHRVVPLPEGHRQ